MRNKGVYQLILAGLFIAIGLVLPFLTGQIPEIGSKLSPMHIPVFLCGFVCGWPYALAAGFITPILRSVIFGMPPLFPTAIAMAFELAAYGLVTSMMFRFLRKRMGGNPAGNVASIYLTLIVAMLSGRAVWGLVSVPLYLMNGSAFSLSLFTAGAFVNAVPAIILHIVLIPFIIMALDRAKLIPKEG